jgi:hypothetical protein
MDLSLSAAPSSAAGAVVSAEPPPSSAMTVEQMGKHLFAVRFARAWEIFGATGCVRGPVGSTRMVGVTSA